jgi:protein-S-isoprenylcysteine O-methyltransferase Ste14
VGEPPEPLKPRCADKKPQPPEEIAMTILPQDIFELVRVASGIYWKLEALGNLAATARWLLPGQMIQGAWLACAAYWLWAARNQKRVERHEPALARLLHVVYMAGGFFLLYTNDSRFGALNRRFLPDQEWIAMTGALLTVTGIGFAIWARHHIGRNWSGEVTIRQEHELIRTGPYSHIRHPIYTGLIVAVAGTAIVIGEYRALLALALILIGFTVKAKREEAMLEHQFGPSFAEHRRHTGFFLPR